MHCSSLDLKRVIAARAIVLDFMYPIVCNCDFGGVNLCMIFEPT